MTAEQLDIYQAFGNYAVDNLFWRLLFIDSTMFSTPIKEETKKQMLESYKQFELILSGILDAEKSEKLTRQMAENNRLFVEYIENLLVGCPHLDTIREKWLENGRQFAQMLCEMSAYWKKAEWNAMITREIHLLDAIARGMLAGNYNIFIDTSPICKRLAVDMAAYMSMGLCRDRKF